MSERGSRTQASVVTFGLPGRLLASAVVLAVPICFVMWGWLFGIVGAVVWIGWLMPWALRDTWRQAALPEDDLTRLRDEETRRRQPIENRERGHRLFEEGQDPPRRW